MLFSIFFSRISYIDEECICLNWFKTNITLLLLLLFFVKTLYIFKTSTRTYYSSFFYHYWLNSDIIDAICNLIVKENQRIRYRCFRLSNFVTCFWHIILIFFKIIVNLISKLWLQKYPKIRLGNFFSIISISTLSYQF